MNNRKRAVAFPHESLPTASYGQYGNYPHLTVEEAEIRKAYVTEAQGWGLPHLKRTH